MTGQKITLTVDALTVEGGRLSRPALERAIAAALTEALTGQGAPLTPDSKAMAHAAGQARPGPRDPGPEAAIGRAVAQVASGVLKT
ncbi:hypothetical protein [Rhodovulum marinum]|uniref:Uncharacterized protein n=1 Tax=Rhodovulum marinum TaxID=320662 RepID=A0A4V6NR13_9RHOB|nr:hypothetical protein [Rhodovulum marinum]TCP41866.1 hypothetical protein EV662_104210 [Rhodovulum marinum]